MSSGLLRLNDTTVSNNSAARFGRGIANFNTARPQGRITTSDRHRAQRKLDRYLNALEAGMEPAHVATRTAALERERVTAEAVLANPPAPPEELGIEEVIETLTSLHRVPTLRAGADPEDRRELYSALGVSLAYRRSKSVEEVRLPVTLGVDLGRVGGGT